MFSAVNGKVLASHFFDEDIDAMRYIMFYQDDYSDLSSVIKMSADCNSLHKGDLLNYWSTSSLYWYRPSQKGFVACRPSCNMFYNNGSQLRCWIFFADNYCRYQCRGYVLWPTFCNLFFESSVNLFDDWKNISSLIYVGFWDIFVPLHR